MDHAVDPPSNPGGHAREQSWHLAAILSERACKINRNRAGRYGARL
jgi:hypothetical protein